MIHINKFPPQTMLDQRAKPKITINLKASKLPEARVSLRAIRLQIFWLLVQRSPSIYNLQLYLLSDHKQITSNVKLQRTLKEQNRRWLRMFYKVILVHKEQLLLWEVLKDTKEKTQSQTDSRFNQQKNLMECSQIHHQMITLNFIQRTLIMKYLKVHLLGLITSLRRFSTSLTWMDMIKIELNTMLNLYQCYLDQIGLFKFQRSNQLFNC